MGGNVARFRLSGRTERKSATKPPLPSSFLDRITTSSGDLIGRENLSVCGQNASREKENKARGGALKIDSLEFRVTYLP